jgi:hypothetical protein
MVVHSIRDVNSHFLIMELFCNPDANYMHGFLYTLNTNSVILDILKIL